jgi:hypothetical protein
MGGWAKAHAAGAQAAADGGVYLRELHAVCGSEAHISRIAAFRAAAFALCGVAAATGFLIFIAMAITYLLASGLHLGWFAAFLIVGNCSALLALIFLAIASRYLRHIGFARTIGLVTAATREAFNEQQRVAEQSSWRR